MRLIAAGAIIVDNNSLGYYNIRRKFPSSLKTIYNRSYRKIVVVDNYSYCGGINFSKDFANKSINGTEMYRDVILKIFGPGARHLAMIFENSTKLSIKASHSPLLKTKPFIEKLPSEGKINDQVDDFPLKKFDIVNNYLEVIETKNIPFFQGRRRIFFPQHKRNLMKSFELTIASARENVYITTSYFLPPRRMRKAIIAAAKRGVEIKILTSGKSNGWLFMSLASQYIYSSFLQHGVKIYEMRNQEINIKMMTVDGIYSTLGSNLDHLESSHPEPKLITLDQEVASMLENEYNKYLLHSKEHTQESWNNRSIFHKFMNLLCYHIAKIIL